ncbi:CNNM domain-containing protein [Jeotgalibacillus terrae]|uniref:CNNM domain-containing protein n=1 Tax=Jeotgalibacillus terrae TaxID=587735 RepID=A0ABW5ZIX1_9BACL|nr:hemolysin family protein [Jeotgalibacillus terrae]MBM7579966.1 CBS domain containing-hemolysin-like protein [Jeotgalibacillus terrae]
MSNPFVVIVVTIAIIALSAFFVMIEFSLLGARRHRLEESARSSRGARAALKSVNELTVMLAGAQLGITVCTFALGAITKPAVDDWFSPLFTATGLPYWLADGTAFFLSLMIVTFLHLVIGEMAPKSWAIAHPEASAIMIGIPARIFIGIFRPLLMWVNNIANRLVKASGVEPVDTAAVGGQDADTIRQLVEYSANVGALDASIRRPISGALDLETLKVGEVLSNEAPLTTVDFNSTAYDVQQATQRTGHKRILVMAEDGKPPRILHVRDTLLEPEDRSAWELARPSFVLQPDTLLHEALTNMRQSSEQLAVVMHGSEFLGIITMNDIFHHVLPRMTEQ